MNEQCISRRTFLLVSGCAFTAVPLTMALSGCGGGGGNTATTAATGDFSVVSTTNATGHQHSIAVKASDLTAGVQVTYTTTTTLSHSHTVTITPAQINDIKGGNSDNITTNFDTNGHNHDFLIKKP